MPQEPDSNNLTVRIPKDSRSQSQSVPPVASQEKDKSPESGKTKKNKSTAIHSILDHIFSQEDQQSLEALSIQADPSPDFRSKLELSGKKYKIEKVLATGGFGRIFQVEDRVLGRKAVVKTLKEEFLQDDTAIEHFIAEAKLSSQLDHPGIVPLFSLDTDANRGLHLAMQKVSGIDLRVYLKRCREMQLEKHFSQRTYNRMLAERLELFLHICDTISYCHNRGVLHNDLKPDNVMIGKYGQVYVMDWGIATVEGAQKPEHNVGSPAYMAPERLSARILSQQTDVFAMGMILNEIATLRPAIEGKSSSDIIEKICTGQFEPSTCIDPRRHISVVLRAIIEKARNPNPQKRYATVQDLAVDIRHFLFHEETSALPDHFLQKIFRFLSRHHELAMTMAGCVILLLIGSVAYDFYNAGVITRKANRETLRKLDAARSVDVKGDLIGNHQLLLQQQTVDMGAALAIEYGKKLYDTNASFYWNGDFAPRSKRRPPGLIHTAASKGRAISLATGTFYRFRNQISPREIQDWANNFRAQQSQHLANVLAHIHKKEIAYKSDKLNLYYEYGSTVQKIVCVLDNGLVYCYPGKYEPAMSQESFIPEYVRRELRSGRDFVWSSPYFDSSSGTIVVSCWSSITSLRGNKMGVIGMVVIYEDLLKEFLEQVKRQDQENAVYTLVNSEARLIYSTVHDFACGTQQKGSSAVSEDDMIGQHSYQWYSEVIRRIRKNPVQNQFTAVLNGKPFNISWKQVPSSGWLLIQHIPLGEKRKNPARLLRP